MKREKRGSQFKKKMVFSPAFNSTSRLLRQEKVSTICHSGRCPNITECFSAKKLTFLILGERCTRSCSFCSVRKGTPLPPDPDEPQRIIRIIEKLGLEYVVLTSVTRDDLEDEGAEGFSRTVRLIRERFPGVRVEVLLPDFSGREDLIQKAASCPADVLGHNAETVRRLYPAVRAGADYQRSMKVLRLLKEHGKGKIVKSALMVGLGETWEEIEGLLRDLRAQNADRVCIGQYFQPSRSHYPVQKFYTDREFELLSAMAREAGFSRPVSGRFVRSSYHAGEEFSASRSSVSSNSAGVFRK